MGYPAYKFLEEFDSQDARLGELIHSLRPRPTPAEAEQSSTRRVEEAYSRGYEDGQSAADAQLSIELAKLHAEYGEQIERSSALFSETLADRLTSQLQTKIAQIHAAISDQLVSALLPVLRHVLAEASVRELASGLDELLNETGVLAVELRGPQELIDRVKSRLVALENQEVAVREPRFKCIVDEAAELSITANDTVIEARLMSWIERITMAVE